MNLRRMGIAVLMVACGCLARAQAEEPVLLKYKLTPGDTSYYKISGEMTQKQSIMNTKLENSLKQESFVSRVVDGVDAEGNATFKLKAERRKMTAAFGALDKYEFDSKSSERDTGSVLGGELTPLLERLTGSEYRVVVSPRGKVTEVIGFAELIADLVKDKPFASQMGAGDNKSAIVVEQEAFVVLSEKPVKPGDKWEVPFDVELPKTGKFKGKTTYSYEGPDKVGDRKTARIGVTNDVSIELVIDQGGAKVTGMLTTNNSSGTLQFDPAAGRVLSVKNSLSLSGQLSVDVGGMTIPIDHQQEQTSTFELLDKLPQ